MNKMPHTRILAVLVWLVVEIEAASSGQTLDRVRNSGELLIAVDPAWPPFQWRKEDGRFDGFDVEVMSEVAKRLGLRATFKTPAFTDIVSGVWKQEWDVAPSVTPTLQRAVLLDFPAVYAYTLSALAVHRDNVAIRRPSDADGKRIGVVASTEFEKYLTRAPFDVLDMPAITYKIDNPVVITFETAEANFNALAQGDGIELDGVVDSLQALMSEIRKGQPFRIVGSALMFTPNALATEKGDPEFGALLKQTIDAMATDGTLHALSEKWFGVDITRP